MQSSVPYGPHIHTICTEMYIKSTKSIRKNELEVSVSGCLLPLLAPWWDDAMQAWLGCLGIIRTGGKVRETTASVQCRPHQNSFLQVIGKLGGFWICTGVGRGQASTLFGFGWLRRGGSVCEIAWHGCGVVWQSCHTWWARGEESGRGGRERVSGGQFANLQTHALDSVALANLPPSTPPPFLSSLLFNQPLPLPHFCKTKFPLSFSRGEPSVGPHSLITRGNKHYYSVKFCWLQCAQSGCGGDLCGASSSLYHHPDHHLCGVDMQGRSHTKGRAGAAASTTTAKDVLVLPQTVIMHRGEKWTLACLKSRQSFSLSYIWHRIFDEGAEFPSVNLRRKVSEGANQRRTRILLPCNVMRTTNCVVPPTNETKPSHTVIHVR